MSTQRPDSSRDSSARKNPNVFEKTSSNPQKEALRTTAAKSKRGELTDEHPERLHQATENMSDVEDEKIMGDADFGSSAPGPARSPGSEH